MNRCTSSDDVFHAPAHTNTDTDANANTTNNNISEESSSYVLSFGGESYDLSNLKPTKFSSTGQLYPNVRGNSTSPNRSTKGRRRHSDGVAIHHESDSSSSCSRVARALARSTSDGFGTGIGRSVDIGLHLSDQDSRDSDDKDSSSGSGNISSFGSFGVGIGIGVQAGLPLALPMPMPLPTANTSSGDTRHPSYRHDTIGANSPPSSHMNLRAASTLDMHRHMALDERLQLPTSATTSPRLRSQSSGDLPMFSSQLSTNRGDDIRSSSSHSSSQNSDKKPKAKSLEELKLPDAAVSASADPKQAATTTATTAASTTPATTAAKDYLAVNLDSQGQPFLKIGPNVQVDYRGTKARTKAALRNGESTLKTTCLTCDSIMTCLLGLEYVVCEACHTINPTILLMPVDNATSTNSMEDGKGAGIGLVASNPAPTTKRTRTVASARSA